MGLLHLPICDPKPEQQQIDESTLVNLFKSQQSHLNYFFQHLDLSQPLSFAQLLLNSRGTIYFSGVGKSGFVANKISQTLIALGIRAGFLSPVVHLPLDRELCPFDLAPVTSTGRYGGDCAFGARNLTKDRYAADHPAGRIGKSLIFKVKDVMKKQEELPVCREADSIMEQLVELTSKGCGCLLVIDEE